MLDSKINAIKNGQIPTRLKVPPLKVAFDKNICHLSKHTYMKVII